jgi:hypothetical protein
MATLQNWLLETFSLQFVTHKKSKSFNQTQLVRGLGQGDFSLSTRCDSIGLRTAWQGKLKPIRPWQTLDRAQKPLIATKLHQNWQLSLSENQPTKTKIMISAWCVDWCASIAGWVLWLDTYPKFEDENCKHRLGKRTLWSWRPDLFSTL